MCRYDVNPFLSLKLQMLLNQEAEMSQGMLDIDTKVIVAAHAEYSRKFVLPQACKLY